MRIFTVIFGSVFVGEIIQCEHSGVLDAEDYCQALNGFLLINDHE